MQFLPRSSKRLSSKMVDIPLCILTLLLVLAGIILIANATSDPYASDQDGLAGILQRIKIYYPRYQAIWALAAVVGILLLQLFDYQFYGDIALWIYLGMNAVLFLMLILSSSVVKNWVNLGFDNRTIQPNEFMKIALIITLSKHFSLIGKKIDKLRELVPLLVHILLPVMLVALAGEFGTAMVYLFIFGILLLLNGIDWKLLLALVGCAILVLIPLWFIIGDFRQQRILNFLDPSRDPTGTGLQVAHAKIAIGSGKMWGKGLFAQGAISQLDFVPVKHSDFIFSASAEAIGFAGCAGLLLLFMLFLLRLLLLAQRQQDAFGRMIIAGVCAMFTFHILENVGMNLGLLPVTGISLPFISYGGSNLLTNMAAVGLVLSVSSRQEKPKGYVLKKK